MWICSRCHTENRDAAIACETCGAMRSAGRFGSAPARAETGARSPRVSSPAASADVSQDRVPARTAYQPTEDMAVGRKKSKAKRSALSVFSRLTGGMLCVLLPAGTAFMAWRQYDALSQALLPLLLPKDADETICLICYLALALAAVLLSLLPGLWTLLLARRSRP